MSICPVCEKNPAAPPHEVCQACYDKVKAYYVRPRERFAQGQEKMRLQWLAKGQILAPETIAHNIAFGMKSEAERWARIVGDGLSAAFVMIEAVDDSTPTRAFHRRRVVCMRDLIEQLDPTLFAPANKAQVASFMQSAIDFWEDRITDEERRRVHQAFSEIMPNEKPSDWDAKAIVHWMIHLEDHFSWMWQQWFECVYDAIPNALPDAIWCELLKKHFADVIVEWAAV